MKNIDLSSFVGKNVNDLLKKADELYNDNLENKIHAHKIYSELLEQVPNIYASTNEYIFRGMIRKKIWDCERSFFWNEKYTSQAGQDKIIKKTFFDSKKKGFFVEIGAFDGINGSNCYHFEKFLNWDGVAIEPSEIQFEKLKNFRTTLAVAATDDQGVKNNPNWLLGMKGSDYMKILSGEADMVSQKGKYGYMMYDPSIQQQREIDINNLEQELELLDPTDTWLGLSALHSYRFIAGDPIKYPTKVV